jgi:hypothetical protein
MQLVFLNKNTDDVNIYILNYNHFISKRVYKNIHIYNRMIKPCCVCFY